MTTRIKLRRDTSSNWASSNPVLALGEPGYDTTNKELRIGNGVDTWTNLDIVGTSDGEFLSDWQDGINDNVWRFTTVTGAKAFDYVTEGYKDIVMTANSGATSNTITFTTTTHSDLTDFLWNTSIDVQNSWNLYVGEDMQTALTNYSYTQANTSVTFTFDEITWEAGDKFVIKYWSEGTTRLSIDYDNYDGNWPMEDQLDTNSVTLDIEEFNPMAPWSDLLQNTSKHSIVFKDYTNNINRNITAVTNNSNGTYTITFDGDPLDVKTLSLETITNAVVTNGAEGGTNLTISKNSYPEFGNQIHRAWWSSATNALTGGTSRSGYVVIDGGEPVNFDFYNGFDSTLGDWVLELEGPASWTPSSTVTVYWYRDYGNIQVNFYNPQVAGNWNNGYKWFDWKEDLPEYSPVPGNAIFGGKGTVLVKVYNQEQDDVDSLMTNFTWVGQGQDQVDPYDAAQQNNIWNLYINNNYPFDNFNTEEIAFTSSRKLNGDYSMRLKVRIMYKFELTIGEDGYYWFDC